MKGLRSLIILVAALIVGAPCAQADLIFSATLLGSNETPPAGPNASPATGFALVTLESNNTILDVDETFSGLTGGPAGAAHIHCCAGPGVAAIVAVPFTGFPAATSGHYVNSFDLSLAGTYNPDFITAHGGTAASAEMAFIAALEAGLTYANIHNTGFPGGEIRGQLAAVPEPASLFLLGSALLGLGFIRRRTTRRRPVA